MKLSQVKNLVLAIITLTISSSLFAVAPNPPIIKYVSVDPLTNDITIAWYKSPDLNVDTLQISYITRIVPSIKGSVIYYTKFNTDNIYTVNVLQVSSIGTSTVTKSLSFAMDAKKSGQTSAFLSYYHSTIFATATFQNCPTRNVISWSKYHGTKLDGSSIIVNKYTIYKAEIGGNILLGTVSGNDSTYIHSFTQGNGQYDYFVEAEFTDAQGILQKSTSNLASATVVLPTFPTFLTGYYSEAKSDDSLKLSFWVDLNCDIKHYKLYKSDKKDGTFSPVISGDIPVVARKEIILYDTANGIALRNNYYKLCAIDKCGDTVMSSNIISNMVITVDKSDNSNVLSWTGFYEWPKGINRYELYRSVDKQEPELITTETNTTRDAFSFTDLMNILSGKGNQQCYYVMAMPTEEPSGKTRSKSNTVCVKQEDRVFIPDAFNPVSKVVANRSFRPVIAFVNSNNYQFTVYNRLSEAIFTTTDPTASWNGTFKNDIVAEGTYIFDIKYQNSEGKSIEKRGTFFVIFSE